MSNNVNPIIHLLNCFAFYFNGFISTDSRNLIVEKPASFLGIPLIYSHEVYRIRDIESVNTTRRTHFGSLIFGILLAAAGVYMLFRLWIAAGIISLIIGAFLIVVSFEVEIEIKTCIGEKRLLGLLWFDKKSIIFMSLIRNLVIKFKNRN